MFFEKLIPAEDRYREIEQMMTLPEIATDGKRYTALVKEYNSLTPVVEKYREYKDAEKAFADAVELRDDTSLDRELRELAEEECIEYSEGKVVFRPPNLWYKDFLGKISGKYELPSHNYRCSMSSDPEITLRSLKATQEATALADAYARVKDNVVHTFWIYRH